MTDPVADATAQARFMREWHEAASMPSVQSVQTRKEIAQRHGLTLNAAKKRAARLYKALRNRMATNAVGDEASRVDGASASLPADATGKAGEGAGAATSPPDAAAPSPLPTQDAPGSPADAATGLSALALVSLSQKRRKGDRLPPHEVAAMTQGTVPINAADVTGCRYIMSISNQDTVRYCDKPIPTEHKPYALKRNYCREHASICVYNPNKKQSDAA